jgi:hypothetical protein
MVGPSLNRRGDASPPGLMFAPPQGLDLDTARRGNAVRLVSRLNPV